MSVQYDTATKVARMNAVVSRIGANGKIKLLSASDVVLATFTLAAVAGVVTGAGVLTFSDNNGAAFGVLDTTGAANGIAAKAVVTTSADAIIISGLTVGTSGTDFVLDDTSIEAGSLVQVATATITHGA